ncbi:MAG: hypothetical protein WC980_08915 [Candidatus Brocadiia bacterium]
MNKEPSKEINKEVNKEADVTSLSGCLIKVFSTLLGPVFLIMVAVILAAHPTAFPSILDIIYGVLLILVVMARLVDRPPQPETGPRLPIGGHEPQVEKMEGKPAESEPSPVVKYSIIIFIAGVALWVVARFVLSQIL